MATQYTSILKLALPTTGELSGTWGDVVNDNITQMVEQAIAGLATINSWTANAHTLTTANGTTSESRCAMLVADDDGGGNPSAAAEIICPNATKLYILKNISGQQVTLKTALGTGVAVPNNQTAFLFCDGVNVNPCVTSIISGDVAGNLDVGGNLTVDGNTTLGDATSDTITATARFASDLVPSTDNARDLGSVANSWRSLYIDGTAYLALVDINGGAIDGVTLGTNSPVTEAQIDNINIDGNTISTTNTNGNLVLAPNGSGDVQVDADTLRVGDAGANATVTSNGAGDLILSTNGGTDSGIISIEDGLNGNINLTPNGTGEVNISKVDIDGGAIDGTTIGAASASTGAFTSLTSSSTTTLNGTTIPASKTLVVTTDKLNVLAATSSSELAGVISDETGTGALVFANSPALVTPNLGTPSAATLTNATGLPTAGLVDNAVTDAKLRDSAALSVIGRSANTSGDPADIAAGTDHQVLRRSGTSVGFGAVALNQAAAITGTLPVGNGGTGITSFGTGVATFLGTPSSANLAAAVTDETGTGALVFGTNPTISGGTISGGTINNTPIGGTTRAAGNFTTLDANGNVTLGDATSDTITANGRFNTDLVPSTDNARDLGTSALKWKDVYADTGNIETINSTIIVSDIVYAKNLNSVGSFTWDSSTTSPAASINVGSPIVTNIHTRMRRCVLKDDGTVNYYLSATDSTKKEDGTTANLDGTDGQVMVEIPLFYTNRSVSGTEITWNVSLFPLDGFSIHPAFVKDGKVVPFRYIGAYDACYWDATDSTYKSGLNLDNLSGSLDLAADKLSSVSGVYPIVGVLRSDCRSLAANRGTGWRQLDFALWSAVQLLYLVEFQSFYSQNITGAGNTNGSYFASSSNQNDSPHTIAGASNSLGNASTNTTTGAGVSAKPGTSFMSFRGIENMYGNCWTWADGINVNVGANGNVHVTNNRADFADNTSTNMQLVSTTAPTTSNYVSAIAAIDNYFIASSVSGGSASTYLTDYWYGSTPSNLVVLVGGAAFNGAEAGAFVVAADIASSTRSRARGARLAF